MLQGPLGLHLGRGNLHRWGEIDSRCSFNTSVFFLCSLHLWGEILIYVRGNLIFLYLLLYFQILSYSCINSFLINYFWTVRPVLWRMWRPSPFHKLATISTTKNYLCVIKFGLNTHECTEQWTRIILNSCSPPAFMEVEEKLAIRSPPSKLS